jgi:hypothetical protein
LAHILKNQRNPVSVGHDALSDNEQHSSDSSLEDSQLRFRNLNEIYENTTEIEMDVDSNVEAMLAIMEEPTCYQEAAGDETWEAAMKSELQSITRNKTWELVMLPNGQRPVALKWVFKLKRNAEGEIACQAQGNTGSKGIC